MTGMGTIVGIAWLMMGTGSLQTPTAPIEIVGGGPVGVCGLPTTVFSGGGCTGTLVHPRVISTAQHCGIPGSIQFGETAGSGPTVGVVGCVGTGSQDAMLCELAEEVPLPVTPVLYGCEVDEYMQVGQDVVIAGFGQTQFGQGGGTKLWAPQVITAVEAGRTIIGNAGDGISPCPGDSGGPVFVQVADGSWRVFGTVLGGTTNVPCNSAADFQRIDTVVPNFEDQTGIDITPCFDAQTGTWEPTEDCGNYFAGDHEGAGTWADWCAGTPATGYSDACGMPFDSGGQGDSTGAPPDDDSGTSDGGGDSPGGTGGGTEASSATVGDDDGDSGTGSSQTGALPPGQTSAGQDDTGGCGCTHRGRWGAGGSLWLLGLGFIVRRRRAR
ncbi:MAG: trypsin-like serine protease [Deltaproteobacteria bacterium]|nr:trypsin-like serine protease [Deltaproteobacteria bacterium]